MQLACFLLVLIGLVLTYGLAQRFDLVATDDDIYFENGLNAFYHQQPMPIQMAPLFSVAALDLPHGPEHLHANLRHCYQLLTENGYVGQAELPLVDAWLADLRQLGF